MPNDFRLDAAQLDILRLDGDPEALPTPTDDFWYNYFGLQNDNILTETIRVSAPALDLTQRAFPRADGVYAEAAYRRQNRITVSGIVKSTSRTLLETLMDTMRKALAEYGATMRITWAGVARYYDDCYPVNLDGIFDGRQHYHVDWCPFEVSFTSQQPYARDQERTILDAPYAVTVSPTNFVIANGGTAPTDAIITIQVSTAGTLSVLVLTNTVTGETITIADSYSNNDTVTINGETKEVLVNGVAIDYTGVIPRIMPGNNIVTLTMTGSGFSLVFSAQHYNRYL